ncbi:MAG: hypothetical protein ACE14P_04820 [Methanotrichaceae archaeon]
MEEEHSGSDHISRSIGASQGYYMVQPHAQFGRDIICQSYDQSLDQPLVFRPAAGHVPVLFHGGK